MGLIVAILLGALVGHIAGRILGRREGFWASTLIGVLGAIVGNFISSLLGSGSQAFLALDLSGLLWSLGGALVVVLIWNSFQDRGTRV